MAEHAAAFQSCGNRFGDDWPAPDDRVAGRLLHHWQEQGEAAMLTGHHYQNAYICNDIEAAIAEFGKRGSIGNVRPFDVEQSLWTPQGMRRVATRLAFIWIGDLQYELIEPIADDSGIYGNYADNGGLVHFHHSCVRVPDWDEFRAAVDRQDLPVALERAHEGDQLKFLYLDGRRVFGHYLEYCWMTDERWAQLGGPVR